MWKAYRTTANPLSGQTNKFTRRSDRAIHGEIAKNIKASSHASVRRLTLKVHDRTIKKRLNINGLFGRVASLKIIWQPYFKFAKLNLSEPQYFWNICNQIKFHTKQLSLEKNKHSISAKTPNTICQAWWWRGDDLGFFAVVGPHARSV